MRASNFSITSANEDEPTPAYSDHEWRMASLQSTAASTRTDTYLETPSAAFFTPEGSASTQQPFTELSHTGPRAAANLSGDSTYNPVAAPPTVAGPDMPAPEPSPVLGSTSPATCNLKTHLDALEDATYTAVDTIPGAAADLAPSAQSKQASFSKTVREGESDSKRCLDRRSLPSETPGPKRPRLPAEASECTLTDAELPPASQKGGLMYDVVLRIEFMKSGEVKLLTFLMIASLLTGIAVTIYIKVRASIAGTSWYLIDSDKPQFRDNFITGIIFSAISGALMATYSVRGLWFWVRGLRWDHRRRRLYVSRFAELLAATVGFCCWAYASSARRLDEDCRSFNHVMLWTYIVRLTCINSLLCIWTMSARGMTARGGGPMTPGQRMGHWVRAKAVLLWRYHHKKWSCRRRSALTAAANATASNSGGVSGPLAVTVSAGLVSNRGADGSSDAADAGCGSSVAGGVGANAALPEASIAGGGEQPLADVDAALAAAAPAVVATLAAELLTPAPAEGGSGGGHGDSDGTTGTKPGAVVAVAAAAATAAASTAKVVDAVASLGAAAAEAIAPTVGAVTKPFRLPASKAPSVSVPIPEDGPLSAQEEPQPSTVMLHGPCSEQFSITGTPPSATLANSATGAAAAVAAATAAAVAQSRGATSAFTTAAAYRAAEKAAAQMAADAGSDEQLYIDAPWYDYLAPVSWLWLPFECLVGVYTAVLAIRINGAGEDDDCIEWFLECRIADQRSLLMLVLLLSFQTAYLVIYFAFCIKAFIHLRSRSYVLYRQLNIYLSLEVRLRGVALIFLLANEFVQAFYVPKVELADGTTADCRFSLDVVLGFWSTQAVTMALVCIVAWIFIPRGIKGDMPIMQSTLQRFCWLERDLPRQLAHRLASVPQHFNRTALLLREPMFCFETAVKLTYWCEHAYYYDEPGCMMRVPLETLMGLYDLQELKVIRNEDSDAKVMIAWNSKQCLLCFRGTASLKAACVDIKAALVPYHQIPAWRHKHKIANLAAVHHGFQWSWNHGGFSEEVLNWVAEYRRQHPHGKITVTGHSLGGAHAALCTLDIVRVLGNSLPPNHIRCYTFGSPRVGNHPFASLYDKEVMETWHVINGNDMVPLTPKCVFWFVYKHPGHKVIVKRRGDLIVRPTFTENAVARMPCSRSVRHHLLGSYIRSLMSVLRSQTRGKHIEGGVRGLLYLTSFNLPEVDAVVSDLVQEVRSVALAAVEAVDSISSIQATPSQAALAAKMAAAAAERGGDIVYHFMQKHGSIRLLMEQPKAQQQMAAQPPQSNGEAGPSNEDRHSRSGVHFRDLMSSLWKRVNLGMALLGVETGMNDEEELAEAVPDHVSGEGWSGARLSVVGRQEGKPAPPLRELSVSAAEMAAFEKAARDRQAAIDRYKHSKSLRRHEFRQAHHNGSLQRGRAQSVSVATTATAFGIFSATAGPAASPGVSRLWAHTQDRRGPGVPHPASAAEETSATATLVTASGPRRRKRLHALRKSVRRGSAEGAGPQQLHERQPQTAAQAPTQQPTGPKALEPRLMRPTPSLLRRPPDEDSRPGARLHPEVLLHGGPGAASTAAVAGAASDLASVSTQHSLSTAGLEKGDGSGGVGPVAEAREW